MLDLIGFVWLSKRPYLLFLTYNIKLDRISTKIKWKEDACSTSYFKFWEGSSVENYKIQLPVFSFHFVLNQFLYWHMSFLQLPPLTPTLTAKKSTKCDEKLFFFFFFFLCYLIENWFWEKPNLSSHPKKISLQNSGGKGLFI